MWKKLYFFLLIVDLMLDVGCYSHHSIHCMLIYFFVVRVHIHIEWNVGYLAIDQTTIDIHTIHGGGDFTMK